MKLKPKLIQLLCTLVLLVSCTFLSHHFFSTLSTTGVVMLYLLAVVGVAYYCDASIAFFTAIGAFAMINYFFVAPRYTFQVASIESWASLISFLIVAIVVTSLVKRLKSQTALAETASKRAEFAKKLAEHLALTNDTESLFSHACDLLNNEFNQIFTVVTINQNNGDYQQLDIDGLDKNSIDEKALDWVASNGKPIGPHTGNWPESPYWLIPFSRLPSRAPIMIVQIHALKSMNSLETNVEMYQAIKACVDQMASAYERVISQARAKTAERAMQEEAIQSALLASISHDMRTPLTSILGAATALQQTKLSQNGAQLAGLITSQARHLANTTENILSLVRLESQTNGQSSSIPMDWQSPEELIGVVIALYEARGDVVTIRANICNPELLIKANAGLITQALVNLIDNASQANVHQKPIEISVHQANNLIHISVKDEGKGFNQSFSVADIKKFTSSRAKGFGLGLSIVQAIAQAHDALLTIAPNDNGIGTCVTLSFKALHYQAVD